MPFARIKAMPFVLGVVLFCLRGQACTAQQNATADLFEFHSGFWVNLHHFLYREAQASMPQKRPHPLTLAEADTDELQRLSANEREAWDQALDYYRRSVAERGLLFDGELIEAKEQLEDAESSADLGSATIPAELKAALLKAAPVYRRHWWTRHNAENQEWIDRVEPLVKQYGPAIAAQMSCIYEEPWPQYPVRVDTVAYADWAGAYTTLRPTRPTISTADPANQGAAALEIVFHEASHGMMGKVMEAMRAAEAGVNAHRAAAFHSGSSWHAVLFYTAGELVSEQIPGYTPYADRNGLWIRAWPSPDRALIEQDWKPHMDDAIPLQRSLTKLVSDLASASTAH
jgi:hypothetical protein